MSTCPRCGKWNGAHATLPGQSKDHLCMCQPVATPTRTEFEAAALMKQLLAALHVADRTFAENGLLACHAAREEIRTAIAAAMGWPTVPEVKS